jgi:hypothetical protein
MRSGVCPSVASRTLATTRSMPIRGTTTLRSPARPRWLDLADEFSCETLTLEDGQRFCGKGWRRALRLFSTACRQAAWPRIGHSWHNGNSVCAETPASAGAKRDRPCDTSDRLSRSSGEAAVAGPRTPGLTRCQASKTIEPGICRRPLALGAAHGDDLASCEECSRPFASTVLGRRQAISPILHRPESAKLAQKVSRCRWQKSGALRTVKRDGQSAATLRPAAGGLPLEVDIR